MDLESALKSLDSPIESLEEDLLSRGTYVENICKILNTPAIHDSNVFAIYGDWGAGKTSVKNLIRKRLATQRGKSPLLVEFNPWAFSGQDQILDAFFSEVGKEIGQYPKGKNAAGAFEKLGAYLSHGAKAAH